MLFVSCKGKQKIASDKVSSNSEIPTNTKDTLSLPRFTNDSVAKFEKYEALILNTNKNLTSSNNAVSAHFRKHLDKKYLENIAFNEAKKNIYIEFSLNRDKEPINVFTNATANEKLDKKLKKAFKKLDFQQIEIKDHNPLYKYTLIVIQQENNQAVIKCNTVAIGYTPPVYNECKEEYNYYNLNACNYMYISEYIYNHIDLSYTTPEDIDNFNRIYPKFIIDRQGNVIAAKITSENKELIESYYKTILNLPTANNPAQFNGENFFFGYNFPTSIVNIIRNNDGFNKFYRYKKSSGKPIKELMKDYVRYLARERIRKEVEKVGF